MATLVLGTVGRAFGGRLGGLLGTVVGSALDRSVLGGGKPREGARLGTLAVQSSAYGEPIPRCYGRMRVAGNLVWCAGIREGRSRSGSSKRGTATTSYSYSASFAVIVSGRPIAAILRIWADGKLLRDTDGALIYPATIRVHDGAEDQPVDPLIAASEGIGQAPAYRGRAYVVFEDLPLADYGNRIPNLTFEVVADTGDAIGLDLVARDLGAAAGVPLSTSGTWPAVQGFVALRDTARDALSQIDDVTGVSVGVDRGGLHLRADGPGVAVTVVETDLGASVGDPGVARTDTRAAAAALADAVTVAFSDPSRDYQPGQQRAVRRTPVLRVDRRDVDMALDAATAKRLAGAIIRRSAAARTTGSLTLPWRYADVVPGDIVLAGSDPETWRVRTTALVGPLIELGVERIADPVDTNAAADPGRSIDPGDRPPGTTVLHVLDLPPLPGILPSTPRLMLAAGSSGRWLRPTIIVSTDGGTSYAPVTTLDLPAVVGATETRLPAGATDRWDRASTLDVTLLDPDLWLESRSEAAVLAGANLALAGGEIVQFADVVPLARGRFRLSTLLRGRRGTESEVGAHTVGERFVVLDDALVPFDPLVEAIGTEMMFKAVGPSDDSATVAAVTCLLRGHALRPLAPGFLTAVMRSGGIDLAWVRRSRSGFGWADAIDAPLGEDGETYRAAASIGGATVRGTSVTAPSWRYDAAALVADGIGPGSTIVFHVAQVSASAGPGAVATVAFTV